MVLLVVLEWGSKGSSKLSGFITWQDHRFNILDWCWCLKANCYFFYNLDLVSGIKCDHLLTQITLVSFGVQSHVYPYNASDRGNERQPLNNALSATKLGMHRSGFLGPITDHQKQYLLLRSLRWPGQGHRGHCGCTSFFFHAASRPKCRAMAAMAAVKFPPCMQSMHCLYIYIWNIWSAWFDLFWELRSKPIGGIIGRLPIDLRISMRNSFISPKFCLVCLFTNSEIHRN